MRILLVVALTLRLTAAEHPFVTLPGFSVSPTEVTQAEYQRETGSNPSHYRGEDRPVENVTWWDAIRYCNRRSLREGLEPCYDLSTGACDRTRNGYRLLTDAEWTKAAGSLPAAAELIRYANLGPSQTKDAQSLAEGASGTKPVASLQPNAHGLFDTIGNVWEWIQDYQDPAASLSPVRNLAGPRNGIARGIRGGSFLSTTSSWGRGYRSSIEPDRRSKFTGFRICRTLPSGEARQSEADFLAPYRNVPADFAGKTGKLSSLIDGITTVDRWKEHRNTLHAKWSQILGLPNNPKPPVAIRLIATHHEPTYTGRLMYLQVEPDYWEKIYVMLPAQQSPARPVPIIIVPYYDVDTPAGKNLGGRAFTPTAQSNFALQAVQRGFAAVSIRWFGESYGEHYAEAVANLHARHPGLTGLGKWVWDSQRLLDYLETVPEIDSKRIGIIGQSLGGKMALYAGAMDDRIRAIVSSEPGIGLTFSNYDDFWYLGQAIRKLDSATDHHELLALTAPRPFLLIGGDSSDKNESWYYINSARTIYSLFGQPEQIGFLNHRTGHALTPEATSGGMDWLAHFLR